MQLCGDAHLSNFGTYAAPDRRLVFSLNDFDETLPGPFEWDVKRLVASFAVAGRDRGFDDARAGAGQPRRRPGRTGSRSGSWPAMRKLEVWYSRLDVEQIGALRGPGEAEPAEAVPQERAQGRRKNSLKAFDKLVRTVDGRPSWSGPAADRAAGGPLPGARSSTRSRARCATSCARTAGACAEITGT